MKTKIFSIILSGLLLTSMTSQICAGAVEESSASVLSVESSDSVDAAGLISYCALSCSGGSKTVYIVAEVYGTEQLAKIGFKNIKIQKSSDQNNWVTEKTIPDQIAEDNIQKRLSKYPVTVDGGYYYRVVLDNYAKEDTWWFPKTQTLTTTSNTVWIS